MMSQQPRSPGRVDATERWFAERDPEGLAFEYSME